MRKRVSGVFMVVFALCAFAAGPALAAGTGSSLMIVRSITNLQNTILAADSSLDDPFNAVTVMFLDDIIEAGLNDDSEQIGSLASQYVLDMQANIAVLDDNETEEKNCAIPLGISVFFTSIGIITEATSDNSTECIILNVSNKVLGLIIAKTKYDLCMLDNMAETDTDAREELVQQIRRLETLDFAMGLTDVALCVEQPGFGNIIGLIFDLRDIFKDY